MKKNYKFLSHAVFCLLLFSAAMLWPQNSMAQRPVVHHDIGTGDLVIGILQYSNDYVITGTTNVNQVIVGSGYQGTITLRNVSITSPCAERTHTAPCGNGTDVVITSSCMAVMGWNGKNTNLSPVTKVNIILEGDNFLTFPSNAPTAAGAATRVMYCALQVDQGAQITIGAIDPCNDNSGTLFARSTTHSPLPGVGVISTNGGAAIGGTYSGNTEGTFSYNYDQGPADPRMGTGCGSTVITRGGNVIISSGTVTAWGAHGAGIGGGAPYAYYDGVVLITGGIVNASTMWHGAGIGSGCPTGNGVISCYTESSTVIALPPTQITAYGSGGSGVVNATLGLAGTRFITYLNDPGKPLIEIHTEDYEPDVNIFIDLTENEDLVSILSRLYTDPNFRLDKVWIGKTDASGIFTMNGFFHNPVRIFTDAVSSNPANPGRSYYSVTVTTNEIAANPPIELPLATIDLSSDAVHSAALCVGYTESQASVHAERIRIENSDPRVIENVVWTLGRNDNFDLVFYAEDGTTVIPAPISMEQGDIFYVSMPIKVGKGINFYSETLKVDLTVDGRPYTPFFLYFNQRVGCEKYDMITTATPTHFTECLGEDVLANISIELSDPLLSCNSVSFFDPYAYYFVSTKPDFTEALTNTNGRWDWFEITEKGNPLLNTYIDFEPLDTGTWYIHWYGESGLEGSFGTFGPYRIEACFCPSVIVCIDSVVTFADLIESHSPPNANIRFYEEDQTTEITKKDTTFQIPGVYYFYVQADAYGCTGRMTKMLIVVNDCREYREFLTCWDSLVVDMRQYITILPCENSSDISVILHPDGKTSLGATVNTTDSTVIYYWHEMGMDTLDYTIHCGGIPVEGRLFITVMECPDNLDYADCVSDDPPANVWEIRELLRSSQEINTTGLPLAGDVDHCGKVEIMALGGSSDYGANNPLYIFDDNFEVKYTINVGDGINAFVNSYSMADIDRDGYAEIFVCTADGWLRAYRHDKGTPNGNNYSEYAQDRHTVNPNFFHCQPMITDFNADGLPEIVVLDKVYDAGSLTLLVNGNIKGTNDLGMGGGHPATGGTLPNISTSIMALGDVNADGLPELVAGSKVYKIIINDNTGTALNSFSLFNLASTMGRPEVGDGATALADMDGDGQLDVVVTRRTNDEDPNGATVYAWNPRTGVIMNNNRIDLFTCLNGEPGNGPFGPSVASLGDIDDDGLPEVIVVSHRTGAAGAAGVSAGAVINAYNFDPVLKALTPKTNDNWPLMIDDYSSSVGVTLFDFNQDTRVELVFRAMDSLRIVDGITAETLTAVPCGSATGQEYPIIVDFNGDGFAEIVATGNGTDRGANTGTLAAFGGVSHLPWPPARRVWNQYAYNTLNINQDLTVPFIPMYPSFKFAGPDKILGTADDVRPYNAYLQQQTMLDEWGNPLWPLPNIQWKSGPTMVLAADSVIFTGCIENVGDAILQNPIYISFYKNDTLPENMSANWLRTDSLDKALMIDSSFCFKIKITDLAQYGDMNYIWMSLNDRNGEYLYQQQCNIDGRRRWPLFVKEVVDYNKEIVSCWPTDTINVFPDDPSKLNLPCSLSSVALRVTETTVAGATATQDAERNVVYTHLPGSNNAYLDTVYFALLCEGVDTIYGGKIFIRVIPCPDNMDSAECVGEPPAATWGIKLQDWTDVFVHPLAQPLVADVTGDGTNNLIVFNGNLGEEDHLTDSIFIFNNQLELIHSIPIETSAIYINHPISMADVDGDGTAEIFVLTTTPPYYGGYVGQGYQRTLRCFAYDSGTDTFVDKPGFTQNTITVPAIHYMPGIVIGDINSDGFPELFVHDKVFNALTGDLLCTLPAGSSTASLVFANSNNQYYSYPVLADVDNDGLLEIVVGNQVYKVDLNTGIQGSTSGTIDLYREIPSHTVIPGISNDPFLWSAQINRLDGSTSVADIDLDGYLDVIVTINDNYSSKAYVWSPYKNALSDQDILLGDVMIGREEGSDTDTDPQRGGISRAFIGDVDACGTPEIAFSYRLSMACFKYDESTNTFTDMWLPRPVTNDKSAITTMTAFDFNQDGKQEIVYRDEANLRIMDGETGTNRIAFPCESGTGTEYPIVVDLAGTGHAEILVSGRYNSSGFNTRMQRYVSAIPGAWAPTRDIWNQHAYNMVSINNNGTVPKFQMNPSMVFPNGKRPYNGFLMQPTIFNLDGDPLWLLPNIVWTQEPIGIYNANGDSLIVTGCLTNIGDAALVTPIYITFYKNDTVCNALGDHIMRVDSIPTHLIVGDTLCFSFILNNVEATWSPESVWMSINDRGYYNDECKYPYQDQCNIDGRLPVRLGKCPPVNVPTIYAETYPSCGNSDGAIVFFPGGSTSAYEFSITPAPAYLTPSGSFHLYTDSIISNLISGIYTIQMRDTNYRMCEPAQVRIELRDITDLNIFADPINATACDLENGGIFVAVTGGKKPYNYSVNKIVGGFPVAVTPLTIENDTMKNLATGFYEVTVTDNNGCTDLISVQVNASDAVLTLTKIQTVSTACDMDTGRIELSITSNSVYRYWLNSMAPTGPVPAGTSTIILEDLSAGSHIITARNECGAVDTLRFTIEWDEVDGLAITATATPMKEYCEGSFELGTITLTVSGSTPPYRYTYATGDTVDFTASPILIDSLTNGFYTITVIDANDCSFNISNVEIGIDKAAPVTIRSAYIGKNPDCNQCNGEIIFFPEGGSGAYEWRVMPSSLPAYPYIDSVITGLCAGGYTIYVRDTNFRNCPVAISQPITLSNNSSLFVDLYAENATDCSSTGALIVTVSGGTATQYDLFAVPRIAGDVPVLAYTTLPSGNSIDGLSPGWYQMEVIGADGCVAVSNPVEIIALIPNFTTQVVVNRLTSCEASRGMATFTITNTGSTAFTYSYQLNSGGVVEVTTPLATGASDAITLFNLNAGIHMITISNPCSPQTFTFEIGNDDSDLSASAVPTNVKLFCDNQTELGSIRLTVEGGLPPYQYTYIFNDSTISGTFRATASNDTVITGLTNGIYDIRIIDANSCLTEVNKIVIEVERAQPVTLGTFHANTYPTCNNNNGNIILYVEGGSGNYVYNLYKDSVLVSGSPFSYTDSLIRNLTAGTYRIEVIDVEHDCYTAMSDHVALHNSNSSLRITAVATPADGCDSPTGSLFIDANGGTGSTGSYYEYKLNGKPVTLVGGKIENLLPDSYIVEVTEYNATHVAVCTASSDEVWINPVSQSINIVEIYRMHTECGETIGAVAYTLTSPSPFHYQWQGGPAVAAMYTGTQYIATVVRTGLSAGDYTLRAFGCGEVIKEVIIRNTGTNTLWFTAKPTHVEVFCSGATHDGNIFLDVIGGIAPFSYSINGDTPIPFTNAIADTMTIKNLKEGTYTIEVTDGSNCVYRIDAVRVERRETILSLGTVHVIQHPVCGVGLTGCMGQIMFYPTGGSGLYNYRLMGEQDGSYIGGSAWIPYTGEPHTGLCIGSYRVEIQDRMYPTCGTVLSPEFILRDSTNKLKVVATPTNASDCSAQDGYLTVMLNNTTSGDSYSYSLYSGNTVVPGHNTQPFPLSTGRIPADPDGLPAGLYRIVVMSFPGMCMAYSGEVRIGSDDIPDVFSIKVLDTICATCPDNNDGLVRFEVRGTPNYQLRFDMEKTITITKPVDTIVHTSLGAGDHFVHIWGDCGEFSNNFTVPVCGGSGTLFAKVDSVHDVKQLLTGAIVSGRIFFTVKGDAPEFSYTIRGGLDTLDIIGTGTAATGISTMIDNLLEGIYKVEITDNNGCNYTFFVLIPRFIELGDFMDCSAMVYKEVTEQDCGAGYTHGGTEWDVTSVILGSVDSIRYFVNGTLYSSGKLPAPSLDGTNFPVGLSHVIVVGYLEDLTDTCEFDVRVFPVPPITIGTIFAHKDPTCGNDDGCIIMRVNGGTGAYRYSINGEEFEDLLSDTICGLPAGIYSIRIIGTENYNCDTVVSDLIALNDSSNLRLSVVPEPTQTCIDATGALVLITTGGKPTFTYTYYRLPEADGELVVPPLPTADNKIIGLPAGTYRASVTDGNGCIAFSDTATIETLNPDLEIDLIVTQHSECKGVKGAAVLTVTTTLPYTYTFRGVTKSLDSPTGPGNTDEIELDDLSAGTYTISVTNSCGTKTVTFTIENCNTLK